MTIASNLTSHHEAQREFFDCPNCWGHQEYNCQSRPETHTPADKQYPGYVHLRTSSGASTVKDGQSA